MAKFHCLMRLKKEKEEKDKLQLENICGKIKKI
jgi:hypothetical protein